MSTWKVGEGRVSGTDDGPRTDGPEREPDDLPSLSLDDVMSEPRDAHSLGELLGDRYAPLSLLGEGTFGEVIRARDRVLGREVAVKRIRLEAFSAPRQLEEVKERFLREAQVAAQLRHPNIVTTHDVVSTPRASFMVMELVEGRDLQSLLRGRGRLGLGETLDILDQVAAALDHAHGNRVIHRDVKPANVMIEPTGQVKVMDFGIAKVEQGGSRTSTGLILGTPDYMSPEQAKGGKVDARADVFSLGCVLYECLCGAKPFHDDSVTAILLKVVIEPAPPIDFEALGLPRSLDGVLRKAMAKEPALRFATAGELMAAARQAARGVEPAGPPVGRSGTLVTTPALADETTVGHPTRPEGHVALSGETSTPVAAKRRLPTTHVVLALVTLAAGIVGTIALQTPGGRPSLSPAGDGSLVVEEEVGLFGRLLGREPRLFVTVPTGTTLSLEMRSPVSSATARSGDAITAEVLEPVAVEGQEAIGRGSQVVGRVAQVEPAKAAGGRGHLALRFDAVVLTDGARVRLHADPVELVAPPPRPTKNPKGGFAGAWAKVTSTVGEIVRDVRREVETGGVSGAQAAEREGGLDIEVPSGSTLSVQLTRTVTITRTRDR